MMNERAWAELLSVCTVQTAACAYLLKADGALTLKTTLRMHIQRAPFFQFRAAAPVHEICHLTLTFWPFRTQDTVADVHGANAKHLPRRELLKSLVLNKSCRIQLGLTDRWIKRHLRFTVVSAAKSST